MFRAIKRRSGFYITYAKIMYWKFSYKQIDKINILTPIKTLRHFMPRLQHACGNNALEIKLTNIVFAYRFKN